MFNEFSSGKFAEAADLTIVAAIYGLSDSQAFIVAGSIGNP
jgi:hypothetical protein